jgi:hypothetical protein
VGRSGRQRSLGMRESGKERRCLVRARTPFASYASEAERSFYKTTPSTMILTSARLMQPVAPRR